MILVAILGVVVLAGLVYASWYGGWAGPLDRLGPRAIRRTGGSAPAFALTFDDGPDPAHTPALLDALAELDVRATFFLVGEKVAAHPALVRRIAAEGHAIGNHTYHHRYLPLARRATVRAEIDATDRAIAAATGAVPSIVRPPWGARRPSTLRTFARLGKRVVLWDVNSFDWRGGTAREIAARVLARVRPGSIILFHEARVGGDETVEAIRLLVPALRARGQIGVVGAIG